MGKVMLGNIDFYKEGEGVMSANVVVEIDVTDPKYDYSITARLTAKTPAINVLDSGKDFLIELI
ncbi:MAG TPA: hypothetical protein VGR30_17760 [Candidatus Binatia bacterium]|nr:hypothetical protein [Candidatus Binatia bacterium]